MMTTFLADLAIVTGVFGFSRLNQLATTIAGLFAICVHSDSCQLGVN